MFKLIWKKKYTDDYLEYWLEASVPKLKWNYIIDAGIKDSKKYTCYLCIDVINYTESRITTREFKTINDAQTFCVQHLIKTFTTLKSILKK
jgi:hypothetical protein